MDNETINIIKQHYTNNYNEETRFTKDKPHSIEYLTTLRYIDKYLKSGDRILEIGAGTGAYSIFASYGLKQRHLLKASDYSDDNYKVLDIPSELFNGFFIELYFISIVCGIPIIIDIILLIVSIIKIRKYKDSNK